MMDRLQLPDNIINFQDLAYKRPDINVLSDAFRRCRLRLRLSMSAHASIDAIKELQPALIDYVTMESIARIRHDQQISDMGWQQETAFYDQTAAEVSNWTRTTYEAILASRFLDEVEDELGDSLIREARKLQQTVQERNLADISEENRLETAYIQKISQIRAVVDGHQYSLSELEPLLQSNSSDIRRLAHKALNDAFEAEHVWLDTCFSQLVGVRTRLARKMGFDNFIELGYARMGREDYDRQQVESYRNLVVKYFVPVCQEIRRLQKNRLELSNLYYWDLPCLLPNGNPVPVADSTEWIKIIGSVLSELLSEPDFPTALAEHGYFDMFARPDKAGGGYCSTLYQQGLPFILTNVTSTARDITTVIHETGHAYAALASMPYMQVYEDQTPPMDICEIHSTALEYLTGPLLEEIYAEDTQTAAMIHLIESILFLPYACLVDHFQHLVYENPEWSPGQRNMAWRELEKLYQPDIDYGEDDWFMQGGSWQKKEHIYVAPFYYIDYALAHMASLDLWQISLSDRDKAVRKYRRLCRLGNSKTLMNQLETAGIASPFEESTFKRLIYAVCDYLSL